MVWFNTFGCSLTKYYDERDKMNKIIYVAPNEIMANIGRKIFSDYNYQVEVITGNTLSCIEDIKNYIQTGVKVVIARGGTAKLIKQNFNIPVIEIPITFEDISEAILEASTYDDKIAIVGYYSLFKGLQSLNPLLKISIKQVIINNDEEMEVKLLSLKHEGICIIIGGEVQCKVARTLGMRGVLLKSSDESMLHAYKEAITMVNSLEHQQRKSEEIRAIIDHSKDGYIAINNQGLITLMNSAASKLIGYENVEGIHISQAFPYFTGAIDVLKYKKEYMYDVVTIEDANFLYDRIPLLDEYDEILGAVIIFKDSNSVTKSETRLRRKLFSKGLNAKYTLDDIAGSSQNIKEVKKQAEKYAETDSTILISGETGVGKELFAQGIHNKSNRKDGPFVGVNCASLPESILESELFGYEEGAFTGAKKNGKPGLFELAHDGTIFLDEISEIPLVLQGRLLRVIQEKEVMRLGSDKVIPINIRIITATNKDLLRLVETGSFREDLYYRINVLRLKIPPLRDRKEDIMHLVDIFATSLGRGRSVSLNDKIKETFISHSWPGNVRELQNAVERIVVLDSEDLNTIDEVRQVLPTGCETINNKGPRLTEELIIKALIENNNNMSKTAEKLSIHRTTLWRYINRYKISIK